MFKFSRNKKKSPPMPVPDAAHHQALEGDANGLERKEEPARLPLRVRLRASRQALGERMADLFHVARNIDAALMEEIETLLLTADVGVDTTKNIIDSLRLGVKRRELNDSAALFQALRSQLADLLTPVQSPLEVDAGAKPFVILIVGINGAGKTTTIGKLAKRLKLAGHSIMLAAGDTFRAAAVEQLKTWGERNEVPVIAQQTGADSASVVFDALSAARARHIDVLIADTAGRLHTQTNLMDELSKIKRVMHKIDPATPHEVLLVLDGGTGQNALNQAQQFDAAVDVTGIAVTKLDGTAKGGMLFALAKKTGKPIRFIGVGEAADDLRVFNARDYVDALLPESL